jgi:hypothetical protein
MIDKEILKIIKSNVCISTDDECGPVVLGMEKSALEIKKMLQKFEYKELIAILAKPEPKY